VPVRSCHVSYLDSDGVSQASESAGRDCQRRPTNSMITVASAMIIPTIPTKNPQASELPFLPPSSKPTRAFRSSILPSDELLIVEISVLMASTCLVNDSSILALAARLALFCSATASFAAAKAIHSKVAFNELKLDGREPLLVQALEVSHGQIDERRRAFHRDFQKVHGAVHSVQAGVDDGLEVSNLPVHLCRR